MLKINYKQDYIYIYKVGYNFTAKILNIIQSNV